MHVLRMICRQIHSFIFIGKFVRMNPNQIINDQIIDGTSSYWPKLSLHENPRNNFFVDMNSGHFRVHSCVDLENSAPAQFLSDRCWSKIGGDI